MFRSILRSLVSKQINSFNLLRYSGYKGLDIVTDPLELKHPKKYSKDELKNRLTPMQYYCTQEKGTERPFSGEHTIAFDDMFKFGITKESGLYCCVVCDDQLFSSDAKFESGSGWPSFYDVINSDRVKLIEDKSHGMHRIEAVCAGCGSHLGHLFNDGPQPTNLRYCINSASLSFTSKPASK